MPLRVDEFGRFLPCEPDPEDAEPDPEEWEVFLYGQCHALALVLHEATGWPVVSLGDGTHFAVQASDGRLVDITGLNEMADLESQWGQAALTTTDHIWSLVHGAYMETPELELACAAAVDVLDGLLDEVPAVTPDDVLAHEPLGVTHLSVLATAHRLDDEPYVPDLDDLGQELRNVAYETRVAVLAEVVERLVGEGLLDDDGDGYWITEDGVAALANAGWT